MRSVVDLPQPEGPTRTTNSRSAMSRLKSSTASTPSSVTLRLLFFLGSFFFLPKLPFFSSMLG